MSSEAAEVRGALLGLLYVCSRRERWDDDVRGGAAPRRGGAAWVIDSRLRVIADSVAESQSLEPHGARQLQ